MIVYKITNLINNKVYVGQTTRSLKERWEQHLSDRNKFDYPLYRAIRKYGKDNFKIEIVDKAKTVIDLNKKESQIILENNSTNKKFGYNILPGGNNYTMPQSVKNKISNSMLGKKFQSHIGAEEKSRIARLNALCRTNRTFTVSDKNNNLLYEGSVLSDCSKQLKIPVSTLYKWVQGMRKSKNYQIVTKEER